MKKLWTVTKFELLRYFISPLAYVYLLAFLLLNGSFAIYFGDFFNRGQADLVSMFMFQPWLYLLFIPGISMRLWAEEFHSKTIVQMATMPVSISTLVWGKFFAAWIFCGLALFLTFPFWLTVNILGNPDNMVILCGYIGSFMLAGCMLTLAEAVSALTRYQIIAMVLAVLLNLLFFWSGIEYVLNFCRIFLPDAVVDVIASFSFLHHFNIMSRGLIEMGNLVFFISLILFGNYTTVLLVNFKTAGSSGWIKSSDKGYTLVAWICLLFAFFAINIVAQNSVNNLQFDTGKDKAYTLTESSRRVLQNLSEPVTAKLYFSPILAQRNSALREQFDRIRILLHKYKTASGGKFDYKVYYPKFLSKEEDIALADGIQAIPLIDINQTALFGLTLEDSLQGKAVIPFFPQAQEGALEQEITQKIYTLGHKKKVLGIIGSLPIDGEQYASGAAFGQQWEIANVMRQNYTIYHIEEAQQLADYSPDVLLLLHPQYLSEELVAEIKNYSQKGGKILALLDPVHEAFRLYSPVQGRLKPSNIGELEQFWHIKLYPEHVVADLENSLTVDATTDYQKNPVFSQDIIEFKVPRKNMNPYHPVTANLQEMMLASASIVMPEPKAYEEGTIQFYPLLRAGDVSAIMSANVVVDGLNPQEVLKYFEPDKNQKILAAEIIGQTAENPFNLIVVADSDFIYDAFWLDKQKFMESEYVGSLFDNANFLMNALDYLCGDDTLLSVRGKRNKIRRFEEIENLRRINSLKYQQQEEELFKQIDAAKESVREVWNKKNFEERESFTADELAAISKIRGRLNELRQKLSDLRYRAFADIDFIARRVAILNIAVIPAAIVILLILAYIIRHRKNYRKPAFFRADKRLAKLGGITLALCVIAGVSVYINNRSSIDEFENKPVFPQVMKNLNSISHIELKNRQNTLNFSLNDGLWKLNEEPDVPVYQERIRRLLTTIADARYLAKKSDRAENLAMFDLLPIEDENSKVVRISLFTDDGKLLQAFNLGNINVDVGRGNKAAYINFDNKFQVWEIYADFVDTDLDWHQWTYGNLWDLRYGRLTIKETSDNEAEQRTLAMVKIMLNTKILSVTDIPDTEPLKSMTLFLEDGNYINISFYKSGDKAYAVYRFVNQVNNKHLDLAAKYYNGKAVEIAPEYMEKIIELAN